jgi:hypothetical protein
MSLLKNWKLVLAAFSVIFFMGCAGSSGGSGSVGEEESVTRNADGTTTTVKKEVIDDDKLKDTQKEAVTVTEENHNLRRDIFEAKSKLGIAPDEQAGE